MSSLRRAISISKGCGVSSSIVMKLATVIALVPLLLATLCRAVYNDEAGVIDWHREQIGVPKLTVTHSWGNLSHIYVATERNVLAAVEPTDGSLVWRHVLGGGPGQQIDSLHAHKDKVLTVNGDSDKVEVRVWDAQSSRLLWETSEDVALTGSGSRGERAVFLPNGDLVVILGDRLVRFTSEGKKVWSAELDGSDKGATVVTSYQRVVVFGPRIFVLGEVDNKDKQVDKHTKSTFVLRVVEVDQKAGEVTQGYLVDTNDTPLDSDNLLVLKSKSTGAHILWRPPKDILWRSITLGKLEPLYSIHHAKMLQLELWPQHMLGSRLVPLVSDGDSSEPARFACLYKKDGKEKAFVVAVKPSSKEADDIELTKDYEYSMPRGSSAVATRVPPTPVPGKKHASGNAEHGYDMIQVRVGPKKKQQQDADPLAAGDGKREAALIYRWLDTKSGKPKSELWVPYNVDKHGLVDRVTLLEARGVSASQGPLALVQTTAGSLIALGSGSGIVWERDESLAHADRMVFVELLEKRGVAGKLDSHPADAHPLTRYLALLTRHVGQLVDLITGGVFSVSSVPDRAEGAANAVLGGLFRDTFGFRKLSVYATKKSRLVALDTLDGSKVWDRYVRHGDSPVNLSHLSVTRTTHSGLTPLVAIAGSVDVFDKERNATIIATMVATLNALDGSMIKKAIFKDKIIKIVDLPVDIPASSSSNFSLSSTIGLVTESESGEIGMRVWPDTGEALDAVKAVSDRLYFTLGDQAGSSRIKGYRVGVSDRDEDGGSEAAAAVPAAIVPHEIWSVDISEGELIVSVADRVPTDRVASLGRVLGDRSVLYKYLNPHMKIVVASSPNNTGFTMYLIDQVSGHILHTARHTDGKVSADHPILAMQCENWIVYQYWKTEDPAVQAATAREQARQINAHAIVAMELYESNVKDERFDSDHFSSFDPILPYVVSKTYIIPEPITALGVTVTRNGVAVHDAVMALASGKLVTVSQMQLDPRRPLRAPTNEDKAENLAPYSPVIGFDPKHAVISHDRRVLGIGSINSSPAHLESTSIVAAFGLDVFGTRVAPSGTFDKLSASFSKANLVITMAALLAGSIVATTFVKRKRLSQSWK